MYPEDLDNKKIEIFLTKYRDDIKEIHYKLFNVPGINIRTSSYTLLGRFIPWWLIILFIKYAKLRTKSKVKIGIFKHAHLKPFYFLGNIKNNHLISNFLLFALKIISHKVLTSFIYKRIYINTVKEIGVYISGNFQSILLPHDTYPETFFITQLLKEFKGSSSVCIQHGIAERIFKNSANIAQAIWDGMNTDIFLSFDNESANYMKILLSKKSNILRNKNLKIIVLNCFRKLHDDGIIENLKLNLSKRESKSFFSQSLSIIFLQIGNPNTKISLIYDDLYIKLIPYLKSFYCNQFKEIKFIYKSRNKKSVKKAIKNVSDIEILYQKEDLFSLLSANIVLTGFTTLAFELRQAGFYIIGIKKNENSEEIFPSYIFNNVKSIKELINFKSESNFSNPMPNYYYLNKYESNQTLTCFRKEECINAEKLTNQILELTKKLNRKN